MSNASSKPVSTHHTHAVHEQGSNPTAVTWGPATAVLVTALAIASAYVVAAIAANIFTIIAPHLLGWDSKHMEAWFTSIEGQFAFIVLAEASIVAVVLWFIKYRRASPKVVGFMRRPQWSDALWVIGSFGAYFIAVAVMTTMAKVLFHIDLDQKQELGFDAVATGSERLLTFVSLVVIPPVVEEFLFRGFLFTGLRRKMTFWWTAIITSLFFASLHLAEGTGGVLWVAGIDTFVLSMFLCALREKTGNLWAGIMLHALKNGVAFLYLYVFIPR